MLAPPIATAMTTDVCGCGYSLPAGVGKYGCPNCNGDNFNNGANMETEAATTKRKPGRPPSANPRQNVRIRLPQSTLDGIDALVGGIYPDRTAVIEQAIMAYLKSLPPCEKTTTN